MKKKLFSFSLSLLMSFATFLSVFTPVSAAQVTDISGNWAQKEIQFFVEQGYIVGYADGTYLPDKSVTRAEFVRIVNNAFKFNKPAAITFKDVGASNWFYDDVRYAVAAGFISGYADNTFRPNNSITREEVASIIQRILDLPANTSYAPRVFSDVPSDYHYNGAIGALTSKEIMKGTSSTLFSPKLYATRADTAYSLYNALMKGSSNNIVVDGNVIVNRNSYGPSSEYNKEIIPKNMYVRSSNSETTIQNVTVQGDLVIEDAAKNVYFENVTIRGKLIVNGGSYLSMSKTDVLNMDVNNTKEDIRIEASEDSICYNSNIYTSCRLSEDSDALSLGFSNVVINGNDKSYIGVNLSGRFVAIDVYAPRTDVNLTSGQISDLYFYNTAENSTVKLNSNTSVDNAEINASSVKVTGSGIVNSAKIEADNVSLQWVPQTLTGSYSPKYSSDVEKNNLTVTVQNQSNVPIADATVEVYGTKKTTNNKGEAVFVNIPMGKHDYSVERTGFDSVSGTIDVSTYNSKRTVVLSSTSNYTLTLTVQDSTTGSALSGATVKVNSLSTEYTASNGRVSFSKLQTGVYTYTISSSGYSTVTDTVTISNGNSSKTIKLVPTSSATRSVDFYVRDSVTDAGITGATVTINSQKGTTSNGSVRISNVSGGSRSYTITAPGYDTVSGTANVSTSGTTTVNEKLYGNCSLTITVSDSNTDQVISGADVTIKQSGGRSYSAATGANGTAAFTGLSPGSYNLTVENSGYSSETKTITISKNGDSASISLNPSN